MKSRRKKASKCVLGRPWRLSRGDRPRPAEPGSRLVTPSPPSAKREDPMVRTFRAFAAAVVSIVSVNAFPQNCDLSNQVNMTCDSAISAGRSAQCTLSVKNAGTASCVGNWTTTLGSFDPGTFSNVQSNFANCTFVGDVQLPAPIFNQMVVHSAWVCQGAGSVGPGATLSMTGRVTPASSFTDSQFLTGYLLTFRRTGSIGARIRSRPTAESQSTSTPARQFHRSPAPRRRAPHTLFHGTRPARRPATRSRRRPAPISAMPSR